MDFQDKRFIYGERKRCGIWWQVCLDNDSYFRLNQHLQDADN